MLDLVVIMRALAAKRPIFNSEADFQLALGWEIQTAHPAARLRMEYRPAYLDPRGHVDVWAADAGWKAAIELRYLTRARDLVVGDERFALLNQGASDISSHDFVRDVEQVESGMRAQPGVNGYALALSHDSSCWRCSRVHTSVSPPAASTKARDSPDGWHGRPRRALERPAAVTRNT